MSKGVGKRGRGEEMEGPENLRRVCECVCVCPYCTRKAAVRCVPGVLHMARCSPSPGKRGGPSEDTPGIPMLCLGMMPWMSCTVEERHHRRGRVSN